MPPDPPLFFAHDEPGPRFSTADVVAAIHTVTGVPVQKVQRRLSRLVDDGFLFGRQTPGKNRQYATADACAGLILSTLADMGVEDHGLNRAVSLALYTWDKRHPVRLDLRGRTGFAHPITMAAAGVLRRPRMELWGLNMATWFTPSGVQHTARLCPLDTPMDEAWATPPGWLRETHTLAGTSTILFPELGKPLLDELGVSHELAPPTLAARAKAH